MAEQVNFIKRVYSKEQYPRVIDTSFTQLQTGNSLPEPTNPLPTVAEFFSSYEALFYTIPKEGATDSHQYLVERSGEYLGEDNTNSEVQALLQEITQLRAENLELLQQISKLNTSNV